jgi:hypothetical protein
MAIERRAIEALTVAGVQSSIDAAEPGAEVLLPPGRMRGRLVIDKPIALRGAGAGVTVIDAMEAGPAIAIDARAGEVFIEEMTITGGSSSHGGAISIDNGGVVRVVGCLIERNSARNGCGGAIAIDRGALRIIESTLVYNHAAIGGAVYAGGDAVVDVGFSIIAENLAISGGAIAALDGASVEVATCRLEKNHAELEGHHLYCSGSSFRRPRVSVLNAILGRALNGGPAIANDSRARALLFIDHTTVARDTPAHLIG